MCRRGVCGGGGGGGVQGSIEDVEAVCDAIWRQRHFLDDTGGRLRMAPGGMLPLSSMRSLQVLYERLGTMRCVQLHGRIGARLEGGYGAQAGEIAAQLAVHFESARQRAVHYRQMGRWPGGAMPIPKRSPPCGKG